MNGRNKVGGIRSDDLNERNIASMMISLAGSKSISEEYVAPTRRLCVCCFRRKKLVLLISMLCLNFLLYFSRDLMPLIFPRD